MSVLFSDSSFFLWALCCLARIAGGVCADFGGARAGDPDPRAVDEEDSPGRRSPQPHPPCVLRVVSREAWIREGAYLQGRRVST